MGWRQFDLSKLYVVRFVRGNYLNIASALIRQVLALQDFDTWSEVRKDYLPTEYHTLYTVINAHCEKLHKLPSFEELKYEIRDGPTQEKLFAVESVEVDVEPPLLLKYLKNEYTQKEILNSLENYIDYSVAFEDAEESLAHLQDIVVTVEGKVDLEEPQESMQKIDLFETDEQLGKYLSLGLNRDFDAETQFSPRDLILIGGKRGAGKSLTCANIANNVVCDSERSAIYFTIEMDSRSILQRICSIATGVPASKIKSKNLTIKEWEAIANWWAGRFIGGEEALKEYKTHRDFEGFHRILTTKHTLSRDRLIDVVYAPSLTMAKIKAELDKRLQKSDVGVIVVDYINKLRNSNMPSRAGRYDWTEQLEIANSLKEDVAQEYQITTVCPYQIDASGEARFAKAILDPADAAYTLNPYKQEDACITFNCVKMRNGPPNDFTSYMDWPTLKIGPESALTPKEREELEGEQTEEIHDL